MRLYDTAGTVTAAVITVVIAGVILSALFAVPAMWLWNLCLVPAIPALTEVSWLQMWGIMILFNYLFKPTSASFKAK